MFKWSMRVSGKQAPLGTQRESESTPRQTPSQSLPPPSAANPRSSQPAGATRDPTAPSHQRDHP